MASADPSFQQLAQAAVDDMGNMFQQFQSKEQWLAIQREQKRTCERRLARVGAVLLAMIQSFDKNRVSRQQRDRLANLIDQPQQFDKEVVACNGYHELPRYQLIAINNLRACHAGRLAAFEEDIEVGIQCWNAYQFWQAQHFDIAKITLFYLALIRMQLRLKLGIRWARVGHLEQRLRIRFDQQDRLLV